MVPYHNQGLIHPCRIMLLMKQALYPLAPMAGFVLAICQDTRATVTRCHARGRGSKFVQNQEI